MTSPNVYEISKRHFKYKDANATKLRGMLVMELIQGSSLWCICDKCINMFEIDENMAKQYAIKKEEDNSFIPPNCGDAQSILPKEEYLKGLLYILECAGSKNFQL